MQPRLLGASCQGNLSRQSCAAASGPQGTDTLAQCLQASPPVEPRLLDVQVILMDHVDWLDAAAARQVALALGRQVVKGGRVIWRSAAFCPPYVRFIREAGFQVRVRLLAGSALTELPAQLCLGGEVGGLGKLHHLALGSLLPALRALHPRGWLHRAL